jgi:hypothetical protein
VIRSEKDSFNQVTVPFYKSLCHWAQYHELGIDITHAWTAVYGVPPPAQTSSEVVDEWSQYVTAPSRLVTKRTVPSCETTIANVFGNARHSR